MKIRSAISLSILFLFTILSFSVAVAQTDQGKIQGTVTDAAGAVIPGVTIKVRNEKTGEVRTAMTNADGSFAVLALQPTVYTITASGASFEPLTKSGVELLVGQSLNLDLTLGAQGVSARIDVVSGEDNIVNTASASMSASVNQREIDGLPINGRQLSQLYLQAPGALNSGTGTFSDIRFSGRANQQNVVRYDGVEGTAIIDASPGNLNGEVPSPFRLQSSLENVQEFRVDSSNFPAELGTGTGGQISVVTKSGGNEWHGSAFEYMRRDAFDAANFFDNAGGLPKSSLMLDQFGGSVGGPIVKDKFFFFFSYEQYRGRFGRNSVEAAPIASIAALCAPPIGTNPSGKNCQAGGSGGVASPSLAYLAAFRAPDAVVIPGATTVPGFEILQRQALERTNEKAVAARFDWQYNPNNKFYFRYFRDQGTDITPEGVTGRVVTISAVPQNAVAAWQSILKSDGSVINEVKFGFNAARTRINGSAPTVGGLDFSAVALNISGNVANTGIAGQGTSTGVAIPGGLVRANSATNGRGQPYTPYSLSFMDSVSYLRGNHSFKFGGELRLIRMYTDRLGGTTYTFSSLDNFLTNTPSSVQYLGDVSDASPFNRGITGQRLAKSEYYIGYGQDEWRIRPGLTMSYGLRYEYYSPLREARNGQILFDLATGTLRPSAEAAFRSKKNNFGPRFALTWAPNVNGIGLFAGGRTVFRGGFGLFYGPGQTEDQIQAIESDRVSSTITSGSLLAFPANTAAIVANFNANPLNRQYQPRAYSGNYVIPERVLQYTASWQQQWAYNLVSTVAFVGAQGRNLFLRSVTNKILPGSATVLNNAANAFPAGVGVINRTNAGGQVTGVTTVREFDVINSAAVAGCGASSANPICRPYAEVDYKTSGGDDSYSAFQFSLQRSFNTGLTMNAQYTFANSKGTSAGSNEARTSAQLDNFEGDRGRNNFDVRHTFNVSALYDLPIGRNRRYDFGGIGNALLGGWQIGAIANARSGVPVEVLITRPDVVVVCRQAGGCPNGSGGFFAQGFVAQLPTFNSSFTQMPVGFVAVVNTPGGGNSRNIRRPSLVPGVNPFAGADRQFINPAAFATPAPGTWGDLARNAFSGPSFRQIDITLSRKFKLTETTAFEFRTEVFNLLNTTNFANPSTTLALALPRLSCSAGCTVYTASSGANVLQPGQAYTQGAAGSTFGLLRSTAGRTVGLGSNRQVQFVFRFKF